MHCKAWVPMIIIIWWISSLLSRASGVIWKIALDDHLIREMMQHCQLLLTEVSQWVYPDIKQELWFVRPLVCIKADYFTKTVFILLLCCSSPFIWCCFCVGVVVLSKAARQLLASPSGAALMRSTFFHVCPAGCGPYSSADGTRRSEKKNTALIVAEPEQQHIESQLSRGHMNGHLLKVGILNL